MPVLPLPMIISIVLTALLIHRLATRETHVSLLALIAVCATQSAIIALVQYYGINALRPVQPVFAMVIPPVAWIAFLWASGGATDRFVLLKHSLGPLLAIVLLVSKPALLDVLIPLSFAAYGAFILQMLFRGEEALLHSKLENGATTLWAWRVVGAALIASGLCDVLIFYGLAYGQPGLLRWLPGAVSSVSLLSLGVLSISNAVESRRDGSTDDHLPVSSHDEARDQAVIAALDAYMLAQKPYLDPDLTLSRLARRLVIPAKQVSTAINRVKGVNVSKHINEKRIDAACEMLIKGQPVTKVIYECGFNTKSNFNREFLRVKGCNPSIWLENQLQKPAKTALLNHQSSH
jgi:AraC-like DNA-binding protein